MSSAPSTDFSFRRGRIDTVLVGTALDEDSGAVARTAAAYTQATGARLIVAHALQPPYVDPWMPYLETDAVERIRAGQQRLLSEQAEQLDLPKVETRLEAGIPDFFLNELAHSTGADLIVVGAVTGSGLLGRLVGSTAEHLARSARCPVLIVRSESTPPISRVLAPIDLSLLSTDAFRCGLHLLAGINGDAEAAVDVVFAVEPEAGSRHEVSRDAIEAKAAEELTGIVEATSVPRGIRLDSRLLEGDPRSAIVEELERGDYDLVLLGTRGQGGARRAFGSVAAHVLRHAPGNILLVPPTPAVGEALAEAVEAQTRP